MVMCGGSITILGPSHGRIIPYHEGGEFYDEFHTKDIFAPDAPYSYIYASILCLRICIWRWTRIPRLLARFVLLGYEISQMYLLWYHTTMRHTYIQQFLFLGPMDTIFILWLRTRYIREIRERLLMSHEMSRTHGTIYSLWFWFVCSVIGSHIFMQPRRLYPVAGLMPKSRSRSGS